MKNQKKATLPLIVLGTFTVAFILVAIINTSHWQPFADIISVIEADEQQEGILYIDPKEVVMEVADSYEFSAFANLGTGQIPMESAWEATRKDDQNQEIPAPDIGLPNCNSKATCMLFAGDVMGEVTLTATSEDEQEAMATVMIQGGEVEAAFEDEIPEWASRSIGILKNRGIIKGYEDGRFAPADRVTRAQFITMLYRLMPYYQIDAEALLVNKDCKVHSDVPVNHFAYLPVCFAYHYGWEEGVPLEGDRLLPNQDLLRQEAAQLLYNAIGQYAYSSVLSLYGRIPQDSPARYSANLFRDMTSDSPYAEVVGIMADLRLMQGVQEDQSRNFYPLREINRAEAATLIWRTMGTVSWLQVVDALY